MLLFFVVPCVLLAGAATVLVRPPEPESELTTVFTSRPVGSWWYRAVLAWLAFPVIYYVFGAIIYPFVADGYEGGELGLVVPSQGLILSVVTLRSLLFLLVSIPIIVSWSRSRRSLILSLGAALAAMVGVVGLVESTWLPDHMRIVHGLEIAADSLAHAWIMVALLALLWRQVDSIAQVLGIMFEMLAGAYIPVTAFPRSVQYLTYPLPHTWGYDLIRYYSFQGHWKTILPVWQEWAIIALFAVVFTLASRYLLGKAEQLAKKSGLHVI